MVELACTCEDGFGFPHSHRRAVKVRRDDDGLEIEMGSWLPQKGATVISEETFLVYWCDTLQVETADLRSVVDEMEAGPMRPPAVEKALTALRNALDANRDAPPFGPGDGRRKT